MPIAIDSRFAEVNGTRLHYLIAGKGEPVLLLHGYAQTSHMWRPLIAELAKTHTVDRARPARLRRLGQARAAATTRRRWRRTSMRWPPRSGSPACGVVGHDIGLMVAYAYAAQYPAEVDRIALMDAFLPGVGDWTQRLAAARPVALPLLRQDAAGARRRAASASTSSISGTTSPPTPPSSVSEADRQLYAAAYAQPGAMRAGFEVFRAFEQDAEDFAAFAKTKLTDADAGADRREGLGRIPHRAGPPGRRQRRGRRRQGLRPLADGRGPRAGHPETRGILLSTEPQPPRHPRAGGDPCNYPSALGSLAWIPASAGMTSIA